MTTYTDPIINSEISNPENTVFLDPTNLHTYVNGDGSIHGIVMMDDRSPFHAGYKFIPPADFQKVQYSENEQPLSLILDGNYFSRIIIDRYCPSLWPQDLIRHISQDVIHPNGTKIEYKDVIEQLPDETIRKFGDYVLFSRVYKGRGGAILSLVNHGDEKQEGKAGKSLISLIYMPEGPSKVEILVDGDWDDDFLRIIMYTIANSEPKELKGIEYDIQVLRPGSTEVGKRYLYPNPDKT